MRIPANLRFLPAALASFLLLASLPATPSSDAQNERPTGTLVVLHPTEPNPTWLQAFQPLRERLNIEFHPTDGLNVSKASHAFVLPASARGAHAPSSNRLVPLPDNAEDLRDLCQSAAAILAAIDTHLAKAPAQRREANAANPINTPSP